MRIAVRHIRRCAFLFALSAQASLAQRSPAEGHRLSNGLLVLVVRDTAAPRTEVSTAVFAGFRDEPDSLRGLANLAEHVAMRELRSGQSLATMASAARITTTAETRGDMTVFLSSAATTPKSLQAILELERLRLSDLLVSRSNVSAEAERLRAELDNQLGSQGDGNSLFGAHRLSRSTSHADLMRISEDEVRAFIARFYMPDNTVILVESSLPAADVVRVAERVLGTLSGGRHVPRPVHRDSTRIVLYGRRGPVANAGGYGLAVTVPGLQHVDRPRLERELAEFRLRLSDHGLSALRVAITDQSPVSVIALRASSGAALDSALALLDGRPSAANQGAERTTAAELLDCEAAGDWHYCLDVNSARETPATEGRLDALATYLRGARISSPLWPSPVRRPTSVSAP